MENKEITTTNIIDTILNYFVQIGNWAVKFCTEIYNSITDYISSLPIVGYYNILLLILIIMLVRYTYIFLRDKLTKQS